MLDDDFASALAAAAEGDEHAFARLWHDLHPALVRYLRLFTKDMALAEDVATDVWMEVVRRLSDFTGGQREFRRWLFTLARRRATDAWRRAQRTPVRLTGDATELDRPGGYDTAKAALENMLAEQAIALIATLPREQAEAITLRVIAGLDVKDVAALLRKRPGAVRVAAHRGLRTLEARLLAAASDPTASPLEYDVPRGRHAQRSEHAGV